MSDHNFPDISADIPPLQEKPRAKPTGFKGKKLNRQKAQKIFHEKLPAAAQFIADLVGMEGSLTPEEMKLLVMRKDAADTIVAYGLGKPGTQAAPKPTESKVPLIELDLGDIDKLKKENAGNT